MKRLICSFPLKMLADILLQLATLITFAVALTGCSLNEPLPASNTPQIEPANFPKKYYLQALHQGAEILRIDPGASLIMVHVGRDGPLARLGHEHIVACHDIKGYVDVNDNRADLFAVLDNLQVDETEIRQKAGLENHPSVEAIEGTRHNMLKKVLESDRFPYAVISVKRYDKNDKTLQVFMTLHGIKQQFDIPAKIEEIPDGLKISGEFSFNQSSFGIMPFSVLGGALKVKDQLKLSFKVVAHK